MWVEGEYSSHPWSSFCQVQPTVPVLGAQQVSAAATPSLIAGLQGTTNLVHNLSALGACKSRPTVTFLFLAVCVCTWWHVYSVSFMFENHHCHTEVEAVAL